MLIYLAIDYNLDLVVACMNIIEEKMQTSVSLTAENKQYIRNRLLEISQAVTLQVKVVERPAVGELI